MDENENRNEIAATLFSVLAGLAVLLLAGWVMTTRSCSGPSGETKEIVKTPVVLPAVVPIAGVDTADFETLELQSNVDSYAYENKIEELEAEVARLNERPTSTKPKAVAPDGSELEDLRLKIPKLEGEIDSLKADHLTKLGAQQTTIDGLQLKLSNIEAEKSDMKTQLAGASVAAVAAGGLAKMKADLNAKSTMVGDLEGKVSGLEKDLADAKAAMDKGDNDRIAELVSKNKSLEDNLAKFKADSAEIDKLNKDNDSLNKQLADRDIKLKKGSASEADAKKLLKDNGDLKAQIATLTEGNKDTQKLLKDNGDMKAQIATFTAGAAGLAKLKLDNKKLSDELAKLKGATDRMTASDSKVKSLTEENTQLKDKVEDLNGEIVVLKNADSLKSAVSVSGIDLPLLVNDPAKLDSGLIPLFAELRGISDYDAASKTRVYSEIQTRGKATPVNSVYFSSGNAWVGDDKKAELKTLIDENPDSKFLVVGYASVDGSPESNATLSSKRASEVAQQIVQGSEDAKNRVQAVYFGQTGRFDNQKLEPNRVVEVWRVDK